MYVVARDFGFAPNPFHGVCTLATCKPDIRSTARVGDWIVGMGGSKLQALGRCIFAMRVTDAMGFDAYWKDQAYLCKRPVRNGSRKMMVGDNIYHRDESGGWCQADSHHSQPDGTPDPSNIVHDTRVDRVLISREFIYFGASAPVVPPRLLEELGFSNTIGHRVYRNCEGENLLAWLRSNYRAHANLVVGDPFQFRHSDARYSAGSNRIILRDSF